MTEELVLDQSVVALAGDWHGDVRWTARALSAIRKSHPGVRTVLHLGDFGLWPRDSYLRTVDYWARRAGLHLLVTPGNHDDWDQLQEWFGRSHVFRASERVTFLPRGYRFQIGDRVFMSFGGAASPDRAQRLRQRSRTPIWWNEEVASEAEVRLATDGGPVDVLLTHEVPLSSLPRVSEELERFANLLDPDDVEYVRNSRMQIEAIRRATRPRLHAHGHAHLSDAGVVTADDLSFPTVALSNEWTRGNVALLDLANMHSRFLTGEELRLPRRQ